MTAKGILIDESVNNPEAVLRLCKILKSKKSNLEGESFRGSVTFYNIEVEDNQIEEVLKLVSATIKSPGWFFHLVRGDLLYFVMPNKILSTSKQNGVDKIIEYAMSQGINKEQLDLSKHFDDPFA